VSFFFFSLFLSFLVVVVVVVVVVSFFIGSGGSWCESVRVPGDRWGIGTGTGSQAGIR